MDAERWRRVERVYHSVLAYPSERRAAVLEESCSDDPDLLRGAGETRCGAGLYGPPKERVPFIKFPD